jgi:3-hydroxymyristoyl/3-hydroxydecanoyl-(acyl carrier protein) dehydratase
LILSSAPEHTHCVSHTHPSLPGHFPGTPVVPGVVLLGLILADLQQQLPDRHIVGIRKLKFLQLLLPGERFTVELAKPLEGAVRFRCRKGGALLAEGNCILSAADGPAAVLDNSART